MRSIELWHLRRVLEQVDGNRVRAAEILDISRTTLWRLLKEDQQQPHSRSGRGKGA